MNREKVIAKLEKEVKKTYSIKTTIYNNGKKVNEDITEHREPGIKISMEMADEILALLKGLEPVAPKIYPETRYCGLTIACGACRHEFAAEQPRFCPYCGTPVKREE